MCPPIIAILGHVDHGKTTLLDALRRTSLAAAEPGGITQTIGAFRVTQQPTINNRQSTVNYFTFIDTPGHEAFSKMRSRGANVADIALLVIAADDGVKPQTLESLDIIKSAKIPFVVCINKIDRQEADPVRVKTDLGKHGAAVEGFGGNIPVVEISAKTGQNLPELLEIISLVWQLQRSGLQPPCLAGRRAASNLRQLEAPVIDSRLDPHSGPIANVIVRQGILRLGDHIAAGPIVGKVKSLTGDSGQRLEAALPGDPVQVLGLKSVPPVGSVLRSPVISSRFSVVSSESVSHQSISQNASNRLTDEPMNQKPKTDVSAEERAMSRERIVREAGEWQAEAENGEPITINVVLKADSVATLETLADSIASLPGSKFSVVASGIGDITESDILMAASSKADVIGFRVKISKKRQELAKNENVPVIADNIIYRLLERLTLLQKPEEIKLPPETGRAKIVKIFTVNDTDIAGCIVESGKLEIGNSVFLVKDSLRLGSARIKQLKSRSDNIKEAKVGTECGVLLEPETTGQKLKLSQGQDIIAYQI